jgi:hypothetical protein
MVADAIALGKVLFDRLEFRNVEMPIVDDDFAENAGVAVVACPEGHGEIAAAELSDHGQVVAIFRGASAATGGGGFDAVVPVDGDGRGNWVTSYIPADNYLAVLDEARRFSL